MPDNKNDQRRLAQNPTGLAGRYDSAVLTAAITGGDVLPSQSKAIPVGPDAIVAEALAAAAAGATCVHIHGREENGEPSARPELLSEIASGIREQSDVVLNFTTGGSLTMSEEDRLVALEAASPEIGTLNIASMNYELFPDPSRRPEVNTDWERDFIEASGDTVFRNTLGSVRRFAQAFRDLGVTPEVEAYDVGHIQMARFLIDEGTLESPIRLQLVIGVFGGIGNAVEDLVAMSQTAQRLLGPHLGALSVAATGYPMQLRSAAVALSWGMDCRVGLEDSLRVTRKRRAESNTELVDVAVGIAEAVGRPIATPAELRSSLGPWWSGARDEAVTA
jgi:uncharacterized protein (DUF849 family)